MNCLSLTCYHSTLVLFSLFLPCSPMVVQSSHRMNSWWICSSGSSQEGGECKAGVLQLHYWHLSCVGADTHFLGMGELRLPQTMPHHSRTLALSVWLCFRSIFTLEMVCTSQILHFPLSTAVNISLLWLTHSLTNHSVVSGEKQVSGMAEIEDHFHNLH